MKPDTLLKELRDSSRMKKFNLKTQDLRANFVFSRIALPCVRGMTSTQKKVCGKICRYVTLKTPTFCGHNHFIGKIVSKMGSMFTIETHNKGH